MAEIALIISNHLDLQVVAEQFSIKYYHMPINNENKPAQEAKQLKLLRQYNIDLVVLAKYMQILSSEFMAQFPKSSISITHFFQRLWGQTLTIKLMNGE
jgi:formyltetrahydrofolate deformylase